MGDLKGHAIPGTFFLLYGLWWGVSCLRRHLRCRKEGRQYVATSTYPVDCFGEKLSRLPVEGIVKIILSSAGMLGEIIAHLPGPIPHGIVQHATMYFFFAVAGVVDLALHYGVALPPSVDYIAMVLALVVEGLLFANHVDGRPELDIHIHMLLVYVIFFTTVILMLEAKYQHSVILSMTRAYLLMLQGTWFWAVGIILYGHGESDGWDLDSGMSVMQATIYFSWHCAAHFIILLSINSVMYCCYRRRGETFKPNPMVAVKQLGTRQDQYGILSIIDEDDESDVEFERPLNNSAPLSS